MNIKTWKERQPKEQTGGFIDRLQEVMQAEIDELRAENADLKTLQGLLAIAIGNDQLGPEQLYRLVCYWQTAIVASRAQPVQPVQPAPLSDRHTAELKALSMLLRNMEGPVTLSAKKIAIADAIDAAIKGEPK